MFSFLKKHKKKLYLTALTFIVGCLLSIWSAKAIINSASEDFLHTNTSTLPECNTALVLGCSKLLGDGRNNLFFHYRIEKAHQLYTSGKVRHIIVSGDNSTENYDEPSDMKAALVALGVPANKIHCDYAGFSTLGSVVRAKEIFGQTKLIVVSQEFHNKRAIFIGKNNGIEIHGLNAQDPPLSGSLKTNLRESLARVKTVLDVWILGREPKFLGEKVDIPES